MVTFLFDRDADNIKCDQENVKFVRTDYEAYLISNLFHLEGAKGQQERP